MTTLIRHPLCVALSAAAAMVLSSCTLLPPAPPANDYIGPAPAPPAGSGGVVVPAPSSETADATVQPAVPSDGPLTVTVPQAILMALENNRALSVERLNPSIERTFEQEERAVFDPVAIAGASYLREREPQLAGGRVTTSETTLGAGATQALPTGTDIAVDLSTVRETSDLRSDRYITRLGFSVNQALLQGAGLDVNLAAVRQARLDTLDSEYELRGFAEALVALTEETCWQYALAQREIEIVTDSMKLAEQQLAETRERINVGDLAGTEEAAAEAEVALRRENLINARSTLATTRLELLRLLNPADADLWSREIVLDYKTQMPQIELDPVDVYVAVAMRMRPDLNQARLDVRRGDLDLVVTKNGLLPRMDLFITLGKSGYAESFGRSYSRIDEDDYDMLVGLSFEYPPANRSAKARHRRVVTSREQAVRAVDNLAQLVQVDVRSAYIEVGRASEQVAATAATRRLQEESLRTETEKFRVGKSTSFLVAQAQRDLLVSQIAEVRAMVSYLTALIELHLQQGALLERRGITAPGAAPVDLSAPWQP